MSTPTIVSEAIDASGQSLRVVWSTIVVAQVITAAPRVYCGDGRVIECDIDTQLDPSDLTGHTTLTPLLDYVYAGEAVTADIPGGLVQSSNTSTNNAKNRDHAVTNSSALARTVSSDFDAVLDANFETFGRAAVFIQRSIGAFNATTGARAKTDTQVNVTVIRGKIRQTATGGGGGRVAVLERPYKVRMEGLASMPTEGDIIRDEGMEWAVVNADTAADGQAVEVQCRHMVKGG